MAGVASCPGDEEEQQHDGWPHTVDESTVKPPEVKKGRVDATQAATLGAVVVLCLCVLTPCFISAWCCVGYEAAAMSADGDVLMPGNRDVDTSLGPMVHTGAFTP